MCQQHRPHIGLFACKTLFAALSALLVVGMTGCGRTGETSASPTTTGSSPPSAPGAGSGDFKVALVMSGPTSDNGWNAGAYKALLAIRKALNLSEADSPYADNARSPGEQEENLRAFASKGVNVVFGHGTEYEDKALKMEKDFPKTLFVISSGRKVGHNTMPIVYHLEDGAYLQGMLAAGMSKTNKIGSVGAERTPPLQSIFKAFEAGAKAVKPDITVIPPVYTGSWDDVSKAKQATLALIDQGTDIIMQDVDAAAPGVFNAVQERKDKGVYAMGTNSDQNGDAPDVILASAPIYADKTFVAIAKEAKAGTLKPNDTPFGMKEGIVDFIWNPQMTSRIPLDLKAKIDETKKKITDGTFTVPQGS
jgi:basic membrane lipoprotein Med (substrate-binding protein (PBP1-ABC) superfamily)